MSAFIIFNIQLLKSKDGVIEEAGEARYLKIFEELGVRQKKIFREKNILNDAFGLVNNAYFIPTSASLISIDYIINKIKLKKDVAVGSFGKFNEAKEVEEYYSKAVLFSQSADQTAISNRHEFLFVFDPTAHWIAIEDEGGRLPNVKILNKILNKYLSPIAKQLYGDYSLEINLVSRRETLDDVISSATGFKRIHVEITFKNGPTGDEVLNQMAMNRLHKLDVKASAAKGDVMPKIPDLIGGVLKNAPLYGSAEITYTTDVDGKTRIAKFDTSNNPEKINSRRVAGEGVQSFLTRVNKKMLLLAKKLMHID